MRNKDKELYVDFIGDGTPLTKEEEQKISDFIRNLKEKQNKKILKPKTSSKKTKEKV